MNHLEWNIIWGSAVVSYFLRATPFVIARFIKEIPDYIIECFEFISFAIIGSLSGESLLCGDHLPLRIFATFAAFSLGVWLKRPMVIFYLIFIAFYFVYVK